MKTRGRSAAIAVLAVMLAGCASAPPPEQVATNGSDLQKTDPAKLRQAVRVIQIHLLSHDADYHARLVMALMLIQLGEQEDANEALEIIVNQAPSDSSEANEARSRLRDDQRRRFIEGLPVPMPVWKGVPLTGAGAMCVMSDLRFPASRGNQFCSDPPPPQPLPFP